MFELESGTLELNDNRWPHLRRVLEAITPYWLKETELSGKGIQLFVLEDYRKADFEEEDFPPVVALRALRDGVNDPKPMPGYAKAEEMRIGIPLDHLIGELEKIINDTARMKLLWQDESFKVKPEEHLGQGDGCFRSYRVVFSTDYFNTFLHVYLSHMYTPA